MGHPREHKARSAGGLSEPAQSFRPQPLDGGFDGPVSACNRNMAELRIVDANGMSRGGALRCMPHRREVWKSFGGRWLYSSAVLLRFQTTESVSPSVRLTPVSLGADIDP